MVLLVCQRYHVDPCGIFLYIVYIEIVILMDDYVYVYLFKMIFSFVKSPERILVSNLTI